MATPEQRIADRMREARQRAGISQEEAGRRLGVTLRTYARWERGETLGFMGHLDAIAKALNTTADQLLGGERVRINQPTVEELSDKLDTLMDELRRLREDLGRRPKRRARSAR